MARFITILFVLGLGGCYVGPGLSGGASGGVVTGGDDGDDEPQDCEQSELAALTVLDEHCVECHVPGGDPGTDFDYLTDLERLMAEGLLRPGDAASSPLLVAAGDQHAPAPSADELAAVGQWIDNCLIAQACVTDHVIGTDAMLEAMRADLQAGGEVSLTARRFTRYLTLTHLYDAGICGEAMEAQRAGLAKALNSLSWATVAVVPEAIDPDGTIFRIDLRDYDWDETVWAQLVEADPYAIAYTREEAADVIAFTETAVPSLRADWFVAAATAPPLYYDILGMPSTRAALEAKLGVDIDGDIALDEVERAAFLESEVSQHNRVIERHDVPGGPGRSLWTSYEFDADDGLSDVFTHPLDFVPAAQMHLFTLPNGLHAYMLTDASGQRLDALSDEIAIDLAEPDHDLVAGRSCMRCHGSGVILHDDELLAHVQGNLGIDDATRERIERLHPAAADFRDTQKRDADRYASALAQLGITGGAAEPVDIVFAGLHEDVDLELAAAELGIPSDKLLVNLGALPPELLPLVDGVVKRETFAAVFGEAVCALELGTTAACDATAADCCTAGVAPGCSDAECSDTVCALWPECCEQAWTAECAMQAAEWACSCE